MRLFIAVPVPLEFRESLQQLQHQLPQKGLRQTDHFHCTLVFLGDVADQQLQHIQKLLRHVSVPSFFTHFTPVDFFPHPNRPRVIYAGLSPVQPWRYLYKSILDTLHRPPERRDYTPHVTLARVKRQASSQLTKKASNLDIPEKRWKVTKFCLYKSTLTPEGPQYETIAIYELAM